MNFTHIQPPENLKSFIKECWVLEHYDNDAPQVFAPIADGSPGLIFSKTEGGGVFTQDNHALPPAYIYGQTTGPANILTEGRFKSVGIYFQPHALSTIFGLNASEFTDGCLNPDLLPRPGGSHITEQLLNSLTTEEQLQRLYTWLNFQLMHNAKKKQHSGIKYALNSIIQSDGSISLSSLQQYLQMSERSLERGFKQLAGISPRLFSRICKFQVSMAQLRSNNFDKLSDIAYDNDYADQSHFIRAFRQFTGYAPFEYRKKTKEIVRNFPVLV